MQTKNRSMHIAFASLIFFSLISEVEAQSRPRIAVHDFCYTRGGDFSGSALRNLGTKEAKLAIELACAAVGSDCSGAAKLYTDAAGIVSKRTSKAGEDETYGMIKIPSQYEMCQAYFEAVSLTGETSFTANYRNDLEKSKSKNTGFRNALAYNVYAKSHSGLNAGEREWVNGRIYLVMVPSGQRSKYNCATPDNRAWRCQGKSCSCANQSCLIPENIQKERQVKTPLSCPKRK